MPNLIAIGIMIETVDVGAAVVEVYDRVLEDGLEKRITEVTLDDRETEGAA
jgi:hypothetical protein